MDVTRVTILKGVTVGDGVAWAAGALITKDVPSSRCIGWWCTSKSYKRKGRLESIMDRFTTPDTYAVWSKDEKIRYNSTSGGGFSEFAKIIISDGGLVAGALYNDNNLVEHALVDNIQGLEKLRQSKYISSSPKDIYRDK